MQIANGPLDGLNPAASVRLTLTSEDGAYSATSGDDGQYRIEAPLGRYRLAVTVPDGFYSTNLPGEVLHLTQSRGCLARPIRLLADGRLTGRVIDSSGRPVPYVTVFAADVDRTFHAATATRTDAEGRYELSRVAPGRHLVGIGGADRQGAAAGHLLWHPGVRDAARATQVELGASDRKTLPDLTLPPGEHLVTLSGRVTDRNGRPVAGASVFLFDEVPDVTPMSSRAAEPVLTDATGAYAISTQPGRYRVSAITYGLDRLRRTDVDPFDAVEHVRLDIVLAD